MSQRFDSATAVICTIGPLARCVGNLNVARLALSFGVAGFLILVWLNSGLLALLLLPVFSFRAVVGIAIVGESSARIAGDRQGEFQGTFASLGALASLISFPLMTQLFASQLVDGSPATTWHSGAPFLLAAVLSVTALVLLLTAMRPVANKNTHPTITAS